MRLVQDDIAGIPIPGEKVLVFTKAELAALQRARDIAEQAAALCKPESGLWQELKGIEVRCREVAG
jgi:hypothetical protein